MPEICLKQTKQSKIQEFFILLHLAVLCFPDIVFFNKLKVRLSIHKKIMTHWVSNLGFSWPVILFPAGFTNTSKVSCQVGWELHSLQWSLLEQLVFAPYCHTYSSMTAQAFSHGNEGKLLRKQFGSMQDASRSRPRTQLHFRWVLFHWSKKVLGPTQT